VSVFAAILVRDLRHNAARIALPVAFFLLVATLYPFAVGPDAVLLARTGAGIAWVAALLAALLPVERLIAPDAAAGMLDQYAVRGVSEELVAAAKLMAHWLAFAPALMLACLPAAALLAIDGPALAQLELGLLLGTPGLAALGLTTAALTATSRGGSALTGLVMLPLAVPLLIFGAGGGLKLLAATSLLLVAVAPFAAGAAIRAART
jgi:heme exporter protein B